VKNATRERIRTVLFAFANLLGAVTLLLLPIDPGRYLWLIICLLAVALVLRLPDLRIGRPK